MALGTNDIGQAKQNSKEYVTAGQISAAMRAMVEKMNESGIRVIGTTVMARLGSTGFKSYHEVTRKELNEWIRSYAGFAHVVDFDRVTEAADRPGWLKAAYDCGDHTHPSSEGGRAMASAINVGMFK
jgi:lysophospholipase L1-like esterase